MNRAEWKRHMKATTHKPAIGTGQTRHRDKRKHSAEIELLTRDFLANVGQIDELDSQQERPYRTPAFNPSDIGSGVEE